jgi:hypothetical protein
MTEHETPIVYRLHSTIEMPLETVYEYFEDPDLPDAIEDIEITRRNNTLIIDAVPEDGTVGKYPPTAQLKATVSEKRVEDEEADPPESDGGLTWRSPEEEPEIPTKLVEYAGFKGTRGAVRLNSVLRYPMFEVLRELAMRAERGTLTAIVGHDDELEVTRIIDGEGCPATIEVVEDAPDNEAGINWRDNEFIE